MRDGDNDRSGTVDNDANDAPNGRVSPDPQLPQWKKNLILKSKVKALEDDLESAVSCAQAQADLNVRNFTETIESKGELMNLDSDLVSAKEATTKAYIERVALKNDEVTRLKLEYDLKKNNYVSYWPNWMRLLEKVKDVRNEWGYSNRTRWRSVAGELLREATR